MTDEGRKKKSKKKLTKAEEAVYWESMRKAYKEKNDMLWAGGYTWWDPLAFYRFVFPEGSLQEHLDGDADETVAHNLKPNAIALMFGPDKRKKTVAGEEREVPAARHYTVTDSLDWIPVIVKRSVEGNAPAYMAPVSWFGKNNTAANARFLHAFAVDLDGVSPEKLGNLLKQIGNGHKPGLPKSVSLPQPTFIVNSGTGLHLYYVLDEPVPMLPKLVPFLQMLKRRLTDTVWTDYTSELGWEKRQYQGVYQGFRMPGTATRLNGGRTDSKVAAPYEAVAFAWVPEGELEPPRCSLDYLVDYCGIRGRDIPGKLRECLRTRGGRTPLEEARGKWPEWYERRVVNGEERGRWTCKRDLYDWWLRTVDALAQEGGRYYALLGLASFARKCGVPKGELQADALSLVGKLDDLTSDPGNHFTEYDALCAVDAYDDDDLVRYTRGYISRKALIPVEANKRNGQKQVDHLEEARAIRDIRQRRKKANWWDDGNRNGAPTKRDEILAYAAEHPEASQRAIAKALGVSPTTVNKWLKAEKAEAAQLPATAEPSKLESAMLSGALGGGQVDVGGIMNMILGDRKADK